MPVDRVPLSQCGTVIVLNGASSSGKTSLARALQSQLARPYQHLQLDAFREMEPASYWTNWQQQPGASALQLAALCRAMNAAISEFSRHGQGVIFDMAFTNPESRTYMLEDLSGLPVYLVGVTCALEELARREVARGDRERGLAARQAGWIHAQMHYDLQVDSSASTPQQCAAAVVTWFGTEPEPRAFRAMQAQRGQARAVNRNHVRSPGD